MCSPVLPCSCLAQYLAPILLDRNESRQAVSGRLGVRSPSISATTGFLQDSRAVQAASPPHLQLQAGERH